MYRRGHRVRRVYTVRMVMDCLIEKMGSAPNLSVKWTISIDTMLNYDGDQHGHGDGDGTCKQAFRLAATPI